MVISPIADGSETIDNLTRLNHPFVLYLTRIDIDFLLNKLFDNPDSRNLDRLISIPFDYLVNNPLYVLIRSYFDYLIRLFFNNFVLFLLSFELLLLDSFCGSEVFFGISESLMSGKKGLRGEGLSSLTFGEVGVDVQVLVVLGRVDALEACSDLLEGKAVFPALVSGNDGFGETGVPLVPKLCDSSDLLESAEDDLILLVLHVREIFVINNVLGSCVNGFLDNFLGSVFGEGGIGYFLSGSSGVTSSSSGGDA